MENTNLVYIEWDARKSYIIKEETLKNSGQNMDTIYGLK